MNFYDLLEYCQIKAIYNAIDPNQESIYRIKCREYSTKFFTPLHIVQDQLDPLFVMQALYEDKYTPNIVDEELPELLEKLYKIKDPTYDPMPKEEMENLVDAVLNKEIQRLAKKKALTQETIQQEIKQVETKKPIKKLDFGHLEALESEAEAGNSNF